VAVNMLRGYTTVMGSKNQIFLCFLITNVSKNMGKKGYCMELASLT